MFKEKFEKILKLRSLPYSQPPTFKRSPPISLKSKIQKYDVQPKQATYDHLISFIDNHTYLKVTSKKISIFFRKKRIFIMPTTRKTHLNSHMLLTF